MIAGFAYHGQQEKAFELVRKMQSEELNLDVFTLSALLTACSFLPSEYSIGCHKGITSLGLLLLQFDEMLKDGLKIDSFVVSSLLGVLSNLMYLELGKQFHAQTIKTGLEFDLTIGSSLVTMYSKCGNTGDSDSQKVFDLLCATNVVSWTAKIAGYAQNGQGLEALQTFEQMLGKDIEPDAMTFVGV
ncbi:pentatricopeptide repeat-containing protein At2g33680-like [Nymphaea colorata]|nr:pentatricopeptide repeat-containing protein At2g33680-like [Nymphaea colorata]